MRTENEIKTKLSEALQEAKQLQGKERELVNIAIMTLQWVLKQPLFKPVAINTVELETILGNRIQ